MKMKVLGIKFNPTHETTGYTIDSSLRSRDEVIIYF